MTLQLPQRARRKLESIGAAISAACDVNLVSFTVSRRPFADAAIRHLSALVVLETATARQLSSLTGPLQTLRSELGISCFVLTRRDLETSADVFPIRWRNMQADFEVLAGVDVLTPLHFDPAHVRLRCEQELANILIRLRNGFIHHQGHPATLRQTLERSVHPLMVLLGTAVELETGFMPEDAEAVVSAACGSLGLDATALKMVCGSDFGNRGERQDSLNHQFEVFVQTVEAVLAAVDQMSDRCGVPDPGLQDSE